MDGPCSLSARLLRPGVQLHRRLGEDLALALPAELKPQALIGLDASQRDRPQYLQRLETSTPSIGVARRSLKL